MKYLLLVSALNLGFSLCAICPRNHFILPGMEFCEPLLNCFDLEKIVIGDLVGEGAVKKVYKGFWSNRTVALNLLKTPQYAEDFLAGLNVLRLLNPSPHIVTLVGFCEEKRLFVSEFHDFGDARNFHKVLTTNDIEARLKFCHNYVEILEFIHSYDNGVRVMCDSNDLQKTLSQYLITADFRLVLNDVDALPSVIDERKVKCGHREIASEFAAPEQEWVFNSPYDEERMPKYDEKTDIWKVPNVCEYFLGKVKNEKIVMYRLFAIHKLCKNQSPSKRPSAAEIKKVYEKLLMDLIRHTEL